MLQVIKVYYAKEDIVKFKIKDMDQSQIDYFKLVKASTQSPEEFVKDLSDINKDFTIVFHQKE